jgi:hypothetical protein
MTHQRLATDLHTGPQLAVSTPVVNPVDIVPLEREDNLNVKDSVELDRNTIDDSLKDFHSNEPNVKDPSKERRPAASRSELLKHLDVRFSVATTPSSRSSNP